MADPTSHYGEEKDDAVHASDQIPQRAVSTGNNSADPRLVSSNISEQLAPLTAMVPGLRLMVGLVIAALVILALYVGRDLLIPLALASLLGFLLDPAVSRLKRWGLPRMVAVLFVVITTLGALGAGGLYVGNQVTELSAELPTYQNTIRQKLRNLKDYFKGPSVFDGAFKVFNTVETEIAPVTNNASKSRAERVQKVEIQEPANRPVQQALEVIAKLGEPVAMTGIVLLFVILILLDRSDLQDRLIRLMGRNMHMATDALDEASTRIGQYLRMQLIVNLSYGVPMAVGLWCIGVPGALLWGALAAVMRFVPYIGPLVSAVFPLTLAFAVDPSWNLLLWTLALIALLELISNNIIEPWLYGSSTGLSTLSIILAATFWTALWGPIGLILSTPLTVCLLVLGRYIPALNFFEVLLGSEAVFTPPQKLFQRLLGGDVGEAVDVATAAINEELPAKPSMADTAKAVIHFYDDVAVPALKIAGRNYLSQSTAEHRLRLSVGTADLIDELREHYPPPFNAKGRRKKREEDEKSLSAVFASQRVLCVGLRWEIDVQSAAMAAHSLALLGFNSHGATDPLPLSIRDEDLDSWADYSVVCICSFAPHPQSQMRLISRRLRQRWPKLRIVAALWSVEPEVLQADSLQTMKVDAGVGTLQALSMHMQMESGNRELMCQVITPEIPGDESKRLKALLKSGVLNPGHVEQYRDIAKQACNAFQVLWSHVAWVDEYWVHTPGGFLREGDASTADAGIERLRSLAAFVVADDQALVIEDTLRDPRFVENPYVTEFGIRFFAGVPLHYKKSPPLGALCILDSVPRVMSDDDLELLKGMAEYLMKSLEDHDGVPPAPKMTSERIEEALNKVEQDKHDQEHEPPSAHTP